MVKLVGGNVVNHETQEITREYRLNFNNDEGIWDDPIPPEITSSVLGRTATCSISRTSLLAWSLMNIPQVEVADVECGGWIKIVIKTGAAFDEDAFKREVTEVLTGVTRVRSGRKPSEPARDCARLTATVASLVRPVTQTQAPS